MKGLARIPQETIDNIRNHVDIVDVISHYIPLTRKGKSYKCICPFHDDHDPSLSVSSEKQIFHCFVCGSGGNVFTFVQMYEKVSFIEAVGIVAKMAGIELDFDTSDISKPKVDPKIASLYKVHQEAIDFCSYELDSVDAKSVKQYLYDRGLSDGIIRKFQLGYNPDGNKLYHFLHAKKYKDEDILRGNLAWQTQNGIKDVFSRRVMIPIHDANGNPVGFSARRIDSSQEAKYVNTAETDIYIKGNILYNYHRAKDIARKEGKIFVVEGAMDVLAFAKADIENVVATLGTACTTSQLKLLKYLGVKIVLCYDGDKAGQNATYKFYEMAKNENLTVEIIDNKYGLDPDEIIESYGKEALKAMSNKTISWIDFLFTHLKQKYDLNNYSEKKAYAMAIGKEISTLQDTFEKASYYVRLKQITQFDLSLEDRNSVKKVERPQKKVQIIHQPQSGSINAQYQILSQMLLSKRAGEYYRSELGFMLEDDCNSLALYILDYYREHDKLVVADLLDRIKEESVRTILLKIANWDLVHPEYNEDILKDAISKMKQCMMEEKIRRLKEQMNNTNDSNEKNKIALQIFEIRKQQGGNRNG